MRLTDWMVAAALVCAATAHAQEPAMGEHLERAAAAHIEGSEAPTGSVASYQVYALAHSPEVAAAHARWEAAIHRIAVVRQLPQPTVGLGLFLRSVETRVGPQQARIGLAQAFPWPTSLSAASDAASAEARAAEAAFDATVLSVTAEVERAYWELWELRTTRRTHEAHLDVLDDLAATLRARLEVGGASFADLQQLDLSRARLADRIASMGAREDMAQSELRAVLGGVLATLDTVDGPGLPRVPSLDDAAIIELAMSHPAVVAPMARSEAADARVRRAQAGRLPTFALGAEAIVTGEAPAPVDDSGKDALVASATVTVPLWQRGASHAVRAEQATQTARQAEVEQARVERASRVERALAQVRDSARRVVLVEQTLLPQALATYESLLATYATGRGTVAQVLMAQRDVLDLRVDLEQARATHASAWARLHDGVGTTVPSEEMR